MSFSLDTITARIKQYEQAIEQSLANHNSLLGGLAELKSLLTVATNVIDTVAPGSKAADALNIADEVMDVVDPIAPEPVHTSA